MGASAREKLRRKVAAVRALLPSDQPGYKDPGKALRAREKPARTPEENRAKLANGKKIIADISGRVPTGSLPMAAKPQIQV